MKERRKKADPGENAAGEQGIELTFTQTAYYGDALIEGTAKSSIRRDREGRAGEPKKGQLRGNKDSLRILIL